jgi:urate oxidase
VLASRIGVQSIEQFARALATHFLKTYPHVSSASITCEEKPWQRMEFGGKEHNHAFLGGSSERFVCSLRQTADGKTELSSGLHGLEVLKTTGSEFKDFWRDEFTTLPDVDERIFATSITANWPCRDLAADWTTARRKIRTAILDVFANQHSKSVQQTLYEMARAALATCAAIDEISIRMPNQHHLLAHLSPFKLQNPNEVFVPTSAPYGDIRATIRRADATRK